MEEVRLFLSTEEADELRADAMANGVSVSTMAKHRLLRGMRPGYAAMPTSVQTECDRFVESLCNKFRDDLAAHIGA